MIRQRRGRAGDYAHLLRPAPPPIPPCASAPPNHSSRRSITGELDILGREITLP